MHVPATQGAVGVRPSRSPPQAPQSSAVAREVSQPFAALPSQSSKSGETGEVSSCRSTQVAAPWGLTAAALPQAPQFSTSVWGADSHPSKGEPLQSTKPAAQVSSWHAPPTQAAPAFANEHA